MASRAEATVAEHMANGRHRQAHAILKAQRRPAPHAVAQMRELDACLERIDRTLAHMDATTFWDKPKGREGGLLIWHRQAERGVHLFKATVSFNVPPVDLLVIMREWDLLPTWNGRTVPRAIIIGEDSQISLLAAAEIWLPSPFSNRAVAFEACGTDLLDDEQGCYLVEFKTTPAAVSRMPRELAGLQQIGFEAPSGVRIVPQTQKPHADAAHALADRCDVTLTCCIDPISLPIPAWVIDVMLTVVAPFVYNQLVKVLASAFGAYAERRRQRDAFYSPLQARCTQRVRAQLRAQLAPLSSPRAGQAIASLSEARPIPGALTLFGRLQILLSRCLGFA